jgi:hypothetical protein
MKTKLLILFSIVFTFTVGHSQSCITFTKDIPLSNWEKKNLNSLSYQNDALHGNYLYFTDGSGGSFTTNRKDFKGNWLKKYSSNCLCFDYKVNWSGNSTSGSAPKISIFKAPNTTTIYSVNVLRANFVGHPNSPQITKNQWKNYCLPIAKATNGKLPSNNFGVWKVALANSSTYLTGTAAVNAWNTLIQDVSGLVLSADYNSTQTEKISFDNFCSTCTDDLIINEDVGEAMIDFSDINVLQPAPTDNTTCCPPWNKETIRKNMTIKTNPNGGLNANYTVLFTPTQELKNQMQAYIDYAHSMKPSINAIIVEWRLGKVNGDTCKGNGTEIGGKKWTTWNAGNNGAINGGNFWTGYPMEVGVWYKLHTGIYLNNGNQFFDKEDCANNDICIRIQVQNGIKTLEVNSNGKVFRTSKKVTSKAVNKKVNLNKSKRLKLIKRRQ